MTTMYEQVMRTCAFCGAEATDFHSLLRDPETREALIARVEDGKPVYYCGGVCPRHGGPRYAVPVPPEADEWAKEIKRDVKPYLHDLVDSYTKTGFNYGPNPEGFFAWAYASRFLANIGPAA